MAGTGNDRYQGLMFRWIAAVVLTAWLFQMPPILLVLTLAAANVDSGATVPIYLASLVAIALSGTPLGLAQWFALRHYLPWVRGWSWVGSTTIAAWVGWSAFLPFVFTGPPVQGGAIGWAQWRVLGSHFQRGRPWIVANGVGFVAMYGILWAVLGIGFASSGASLTTLVVSSAIGYALGASAFALITGFTLLQVLKSPQAQPDPTSGPTSWPSSAPTTGTARPLA